MPTKPKIWTKQDIPTPPEMTEYLGRVRAAREAFPGVSQFPPLPANMNHLTYEADNDLERTLLLVNETIQHLQESRDYSGELQAGGI